MSKNLSANEKPEPVANQATLERTLKMLGELYDPSGITIETMVHNYGVSKRTIQRTLQTIQEAGFILTCEKKRYRIDRDATKGTFEISDLLHFSDEECWMLNEAVDKIPGDNSIRENLIKKLYSIFSSGIIVNAMNKQQDSEMVRVISEAIQHKFQVIILEYTRASYNNQLTQKTIEPIAFASDYSRVWAYLPKENVNILLRLSGLRGVKATYSSYKFAGKHRKGKIDIFRGYGYDEKKITLKLNRRAYGFICEEFPMAEPQIKSLDEFYYELKTVIYDYAPVKRFCLGLPGDAEVLEPDELKQLIHDVYVSPPKIHKTLSAINYLDK